MYGGSPRPPRPPHPTVYGSRPPRPPRPAFNATRAPKPPAPPGFNRSSIKTGRNGSRFFGLDRSHYRGRSLLGSGKVGEEGRACRLSPG